MAYVVAHACEGSTRLLMSVALVLFIACHVFIRLQVTNTTQNKKEEQIQC